MLTKLQMQFSKDYTGLALTCRSSDMPAKHKEADRTLLHWADPLLVQGKYSSD